MKKINECAKNGILFFFLLFIIPVSCFARTMSYPLDGELIVTSEYGWRVHPVFGTQKYHSGLDLGADYGQPVHASAAGVVRLSGWVSGYGNTVMIDHGGGVETLYGHNQELTVTSGQAVRQGTVIALAGSTGYSTGPHCHFEVRVNGQPTDPAQFLDGSIPVAGSGVGGFLQSDYNFIPLDFDAYFDFAKPVREAIETVSQACANGLRFVRDDVMYLFLSLVTIDLAISAFGAFLFETETDIPQWMLKKFLLYGFLVFMIQNWGDIASNLFRNYFTTMGAAAVGETAEQAGKIVSDPTFIMQKGAHVIAPIFTYLGTFSGTQILSHIHIVLFALLTAFVIFACYFLIGFQILLAYLEFYVIGLFGVIGLTLSGFKHTRQYAANGMNGVLVVSMKLMFFCLFSVLLTNMIQDFSIESYCVEQSLDIALLLRVLLASMLFVFLGNRVSKTILRVFGGNGFHF